MINLVAFFCVMIFFLLGIDACDQGPVTVKGPLAIVRGTPPKHGLIGISCLLEPGKDLVIQHVLPGTPAAQVLQKGDEIQSLDQTAIASLRSLEKEIRKTKPGQIMLIRFLRQGKPRKAKVTLIGFDEYFQLHLLHDQNQRGKSSSPPK